ncbi:MAG: glycosyltransferase family 4 protein [Firmicutes bacterium]|nr:glycosyltransferase family 4 protein [Bacillota bacterium]
MRVLLVVRPCQGGMVTHVRTLARKLKEASHEVYIAGPESLSSAGDAFFFLPLSHHPGAVLSGTQNLTQLIAKLRPDVVHYHGTLAAMIGYFTVKPARSAFVYTVHSFPAPSLPWIAWREALLARRFERIIAVSRALATVLCRSGVPHSKISAIPNGIDIKESQVENVNPIGKPYILSMGRLVPIKGMGYLLHAFSRLDRSSWPELKLMIAGDGPERRRLERLALKLGIASAVKFLGFVSNPQPLLSFARLFVTAPVAESMGLANLEAMVLARPVVSTRVGGIPEVIKDGETGILVEPRCPAELAAAIEMLLRRPSWAADLGMAGAERARTHFSAERMVEKTLAVYREALRYEVQY